MWSKAFRNRNKADRVSVCEAVDTRLELSRMLHLMHIPLQPHENKKARAGKVSGWSGLTPGRIKKYRLGYINEPKSREEKSIRAAFREWKAELRASGLARLIDHEGEHAELQDLADQRRAERGADGYSASRWQRALETGARPGPVGTKASTADED